MLNACDTSTPIGFRDYVILLLLLNTGMRVAEIASLRVENVHETYIKVEGKGRKEREIGIHPEMSKLLWKYVSKYRSPSNPNEPMLLLGRGKPLHISGIQHVVKRIQSATGLSDIKFTAHVFRHTHSKMYLDNGGELFKLSRELGHSSIQVTKIYLEDFGSSEARKDHDSFSPLSVIPLRRKVKKTRKVEGE